MKGRLIGIVTCACVLLSTAAFAADSAMFITKCGGCHKKGGEAAPVNPADKAGVVWDKFFKRDRHPVNISAAVSAGDLESVVAYLMAHAADSDQPEAAAIPK